MTSNHVIEISNEKVVWNKDYIEALRGSKVLFDEGILTSEEFTNYKKELWQKNELRYKERPGNITLVLNNGDVNPWVDGTKKYREGVQEAKQLFDEGIFTQEDFETEKKSLFEEWVEGPKQKQSRKEHICKFCEKTFKRKSKLKEHIDAVHRKKKPFSCDMCDYSSVQKINLERHHKSVHQRLKLFQCMMCEKKFTQNKNLMRHSERFHSIKKTPNQ